LSKVENTYWTNMQSTPSIKRRANKGRTVNRTTSLSLLNRSHLWTFGIAGTTTLLLCLTINFRAFSEWNHASTNNSTLEARIQGITSENLALQEEIHYLKNDSGTVEREALKFGLQRPRQSRDER